jgi:hypothetical protein
MVQDRGADPNDLPEDNVKTTSREPFMVRFAVAFSDADRRASLAIMALFAAVIALATGGFLISPPVGAFCLAAGLGLVALAFGRTDTEPEEGD